MNHVDIEELAKNKHLAQMQREVAIATKKLLMDEMSHASRWIMASVLAINSGGLIACLGKSGGFGAMSVGAASAFYLGVLLAMMMGWKLVKMNQMMLPLHSRFIAAWELAAIDGVIDSVELNEAAAQIVVFAKQEIGLPSILGKLSFFSFTIGLAVMAVTANATADAQIAAEKVSGQK